MRLEINRRSLVMRSALATHEWSSLKLCRADMLCFDLEDGTAEEHKVSARDAVSTFINEVAVPTINAAPQLYVRINSLQTLHGLEDLLALAKRPGQLTGLLIPKSESADEIRLIANLLADVACDIELILLIETPLGVRNAAALAGSSPAVAALFLGSVDLSGELGSNMQWDALVRARSILVEAASEHGLDCIDGPWLSRDDLAGLRTEAARVAAMGFTGKACYDVEQIEHIHAAFTPSIEQLQQAHAIIAAVSSSMTGAARVEGRSVNKANAKAARRLLALAKRFGVNIDADASK